MVKVKVPASAVLDAAAFVDAEQAASAEPKRAAAAEAVNRSFLMLRCTDMAPRIEVDALAWLVCVLQEERLAHGIPNTSKRAENQKGDIWWDFNNDLWRCRTYNAEKEVQMHTRGVRPRMLKGLKDCSFAQAKSLVYEEMVLWRAAAASG